MMISIEERLAESAPSFTSQFVRIPGMNESAKASLPMDIEGSPMKTESCPGITFVAITYGKAEMLHSTMFRTGFADFLSKVWLVIRDEGQQAGPSSSTQLLCKKMRATNDKPAIHQIQKDEAVNNSSSPNPPFELPDAPTLDEILRAGSEKGDIELEGPLWISCKETVLSMGRHIFPGGPRKLGFVIPHRDTEAALENFFGRSSHRIGQISPCH